MTEVLNCYDDPLSLNNELMHFFCSFQDPLCWWTLPSMPWVIVLSCCCRLWVKMTRTASSSATSCTVAMATARGPYGRMFESTGVRSAVRSGTHPGLMSSSGTRWSWRSAPSGLMNTRYKLRHYQVEILYPYMWCSDLIWCCVNETRCSSDNEEFDSQEICFPPVVKICRPMYRHLVQMNYGTQ